MFFFHVPFQRAFISLFVLTLALLSCPVWPDENLPEDSRSEFLQAKRLYDEGKIGQAQEAFTRLAEADPRDRDSRRYLRSIISLRRKMARRDQGVLYRDRILDVRRSWIPVEHKTGPRGSEAQAKGQPAQLPMSQRVKQIIPEIAFTDAQVGDVLRYLSEISSINLVFDQTTGARVDQDEVSKALSSRITLSLKDVPLLETIKYILDAKGLKYRLDEHAIVISTKARLEKVEMETRYYHLSTGNTTEVSKKKRFPSRGTSPTADSQEEEEESGDEADSEETAVLSSPVLNIKDVLAQSGVPFPSGSKIFLDKRTGILLVRNTPSNLAVIEKILGALDVAPFQVAIEAKFVDIEEVDARELGLEAFLRGDFALSKLGGANDSTILANANNTVFGQYTGTTQGRGGFTKGLTFLTDNILTSTAENVIAGSGSSSNPSGNIFSIAQVLTQPQFQLVLHALEQSGLANVLSAPKVTTINNREAVIEVVTEIIYPTEYEITAPTTNTAGTIITPGIALPGGFVTRDTGVTLEVTPSVGADKKTISLTLKPEVSSLSGWTNYGVSAGPSNLGSNAVPVLQPIFTTQNLSTNVIVQDGETVMLGGLIREVTDTSEDKIPVLGDIPGIGRIFRVDYESAKRRNLLIFVTAYLISPEGQTLREPRIEKTRIFNP